MKDRIIQLMIIGGIYLPISLLFTYLPNLSIIKDIPQVNHYFQTASFAWTRYLIFILFLFLTVVLFLFPTSKFNKEFVKDFPKSYTFLASIGWVPYFALPLTVFTEYFKDGVPEEYYDKLVLYSQVYEYAVPGSFLLAVFLVWRKSVAEENEKETKSRYKNRY